MKEIKKVSDCQLWEFEEEIVLEYFEEDDTSNSNIEEINRCLEALKEYEFIVQPLSVEFGVKYRHRQRLAFNLDYRNRPKIPYWHWEISSIPPKIIAEGLYPDSAKVIPVENITTEDLREWVKEPLKQKSPNLEYDVHWSEINIWATRARIIDEIRFIDRDDYSVETKIGEIKYPLRRHDDGLWVYGPQKPYSSYPPMTIRLYTDGDGAIKMKILIPWTVWYDEYSPEYYYLYQAVQRIIAQGWELSEYTPLEEPKYAA